MLLRPGLLRLCTALYLAILATAPAAAQAINGKSVDGLVDEALRAWKVPGVSMCIVQDDKVVYLKGFGVRDVTEKKARHPRHSLCLQFVHQSGRRDGAGAARG